MCCEIDAKNLHKIYLNSVCVITRSISVNRLRWNLVHLWAACSAYRYSNTHFDYYHRIALWNGCMPLSQSNINLLLSLPLRAQCALWLFRSALISLSAERKATNLNIKCIYYFKWIRDQYFRWWKWKCCANTHLTVYLAYVCMLFLVQFYFIYFWYKENTTKEITHH